MLQRQLNHPPTREHDDVILSAILKKILSATASSGMLRCTSIIYVVSLFRKQRQGIRQDGGLIVKILLETIHGRGRYCPGYTNNILRPQTSSSACIVCDTESDPWLVLGPGPKLNLIMNRIYSYKLKAILLTFSGSETIM